LIELRGVSKTVSSGGQPLTILHPLDLTVPDGQFLAIVGPSGSGKTTLLGLMAGLDRPSAGEVWLEGRRIDDLSEDALAKLRRGRVGFVFQSFQLLPSLTALENVMLPLELAGRADAEAVSRGILRQVGLGERLSHYPKHLSGGEQQRVALARAWALHPEVLFLDEPTASLDPGATREIEGVIRAFDAAGTKVVMVTHNLGQARRLGDEVVFLHQGRVVERAPVESFFKHPSSAEAAAFIKGELPWV